MEHQSKEGKLNELKEGYTPISIWQGGEESKGHSTNQVRNDHFLCINESSRK